MVLPLLSGGPLPRYRADHAPRQIASATARAPFPRPIANQAAEFRSKLHLNLG